MNSIEEKKIAKSFEDVQKEIHPWDKWGPYVSERGWGSVREDYSADGDAWQYFPHDHARMRAYRRCEDGIAGISDRFQVLLFAPAFWNGKDEILKERLFGVNCFEGNHGEDVKEVYYYLDAIPSHSYLKYLYKYPQTAYPYDHLVQENQKRGAKEREYELVDTGIFDENRYFDIFIEYAKAGPEDICIKIEAFNRGPEAAPLHVLPHLWFRNQWAWSVPRQKEPIIKIEEKGENLCLSADDSNLDSPQYLLFDYHLRTYYLYAPSNGIPLFTHNETNQKTLWNQSNETPYVKDAFHRHLVQKEQGVLNPNQVGTKAAIHYLFPSIEPGKSSVLLLRLTNKKIKAPLEDVETIIAEQKKEADLYYQNIHPKSATDEEKSIQRQALAGMIWNKQIYIYHVGNWLDGDNPLDPPPESHRWIRNFHWRHIISYRIFSMPDKWEFPWFAAWDLAFHSLTFALIDIDFAKHQMWLLLFDQFQHPNGAIPAYEWEFSDVNPPVQAWAVLKLFEIEKEKRGIEDYAFMEKCFHKLLLNFSWWINKVDSLGHNIFEGGFLGMDNIGIADRSQKSADILIDQADGAGWMALLCLNLMRIALTLARKNKNYELLGIKFFQHFIYVAASLRKGYWRGYDMWSEDDAFFYSYVRYPDGHTEIIPSRSLVGIIPFFACDVWSDEELKKFPEFFASYEWMVQKRPHLADKCIQKIPYDNGTHHLFGLLSADEIAQFLTKNIWNPNEFRSEYGLRSLSKYHEKNPVKKYGFTLSYEPGEAEEKIKGGNSNWRGPIWFPLNYFLIDTLFRLGRVFKDDMKISAGNEPPVNLNQMAKSFEKRLLKIFQLDADNRRPIFGDYEKFQKDPYFKDHLFFFEHFHGDSGRGLGASHQNGWTALIANLIQDIYR